MTDGGRFAFQSFDHVHLPELTDLWISSWTRAIPEIDFEARRAWFVDHLLALHAAGVQVRLAFDTCTGTLSGFMTLAPASGHVDQIAVATTYWGTECATLLVNWAKGQVRRGGRGLLFLDVNQENPRAVRFYEREGFRRVRAGVNSNSGRATWRYEWQA